MDRLIGSYSERHEQAASHRHARIKHAEGTAPHEWGAELLAQARALLDRLNQLRIGGCPLQSIE